MGEGTHDNDVKLLSGKLARRALQLGAHGRHLLGGDAMRSRFLVVFCDHGGADVTTHDLFRVQDKLE